MIPASLVARFGPTVAKLIFWGGLILVLALVLSVGKCVYDRGAKTEINLRKNQTGAAVESGSDAVDTVGNRAAADQEALDHAKETQDEINKQTTASGVTGAGRRGLCDRAPNRRGCEPVQRAAPR